jgi:16S rRNA (cytidine1402-2'-O)-methyltransferase
MSSEIGGTLYLVPNTLGEEAAEAVIPGPALELARTLNYFIAEEPKSARAFLKRIGFPRPIQGVRIERLDHHTAPADVLPLLQPVLSGANAGLLSEAGMPAIADPGANLVQLAHRHGVRVVPLVGPSSILLALAASGLNGQRFSFHGYLPVDENALAAALKELERQSRQAGSTEIFIETPYRNERTLAAMLRALNPGTLVSIASDLTLSGQAARTLSVAEWRRAPPALKGKPTVFLLLAV